MALRLACVALVVVAPACGLVTGGDERADPIPATLLTTSTTTPTSTTEPASSSDATTIPPSEIIRPSSPEADPTAARASTFLLDPLAPVGDPECSAARSFLMAGLTLSTTPRTAPVGEYAARTDAFAQALVRLIDSSTGFLRDRSTAFTADLQQFQRSLATSDPTAIRTAGDEMLGLPGTGLTWVIEAVTARCPDVAQGVPAPPFFREQ